MSHIGVIVTHIFVPIRHICITMASDEPASAKEIEGSKRKAASVGQSEKAGGMVKVLKGPGGTKAAPPEPSSGSSGSEPAGPEVGA